MSQYERRNIAAMHGYTSGEQPQDAHTIKLNTNENPYPPSPRVSTALNDLDITRLRTYPQPTADSLRDAIAELHELGRQQVVVTNGGDEALRLALTTFVEVGGKIGMAEPSYSLYPVLADIHDAQICRVDLDENWQLPIDSAKQLNEANVSLTCIVNPHAPSGTLISVDAVAHLARELDGLLLLDEAYIDFSDPESSNGTAKLVDAFDNLLILRTFSKGYSLAGMRLGYLLGSSELITPIITKTRDSYNIDVISQTLGLAAITDQAYAQETWTKVRSERTRLQQNLNQLGLGSPPSESNFLLVTVPKRDTPTALSAEHLYTHLKAKGILVRWFDTPRLRDKLRITIGTQAQNERLLAELTEHLQPDAYEPTA